MFDVLKRNVRVAFLGLDPPRAKILQATFDDETPTSDSLTDEVIALLRGQTSATINKEEACALVVGRMKDDPSQNVLLKSLMIFRGFLTSHYTNSSEIKELFGDMSVFKLYDNQQEQVAGNYAKVLSHWVKCSGKDDHILHKDNGINSIMALWRDGKVNKSNVVSDRSNDQLLIDCEDLLDHIRLLVECHVILRPRQSHSRDQTRAKKKTSNTAAIEYRSSGNIELLETSHVMPRSTFPNLLLQHILEVLFDIERFLICAKTMLIELAQRSTYRIIKPDDYTDAITLFQQYATYAESAKQLHMLVEMTDNESILNQLKLTDRLSSTEVTTAMLSGYWTCVGKVGMQISRESDEENECDRKHNLQTCNTNQF